MAAKKKTRKTQKKQQNKQQEIMVYVYSLALITLSIIGCLKIGFVGEVLTGVIQLVFGNLYGVLYAVVIVFSILWMLKKSVKDIPLQYSIGVGVLLTAWILASALPEDETIKGMAIFNSYVKNAFSVLTLEASSKGGIIGALLVSVCTFLFDFIGTKILIIALLVLGCILIISGPVYAHLKQRASSVKKPIAGVRESLKQKKENRNRAKQQEEDDQVDEKENTMQIVFVRNKIDERIRPGQVYLLVVDEEKKTSVLEDKKQEDKRIIEETIGMKDTFTSSFDEDYTNYRLPRLTLLNDAGKKGRSRTNIEAANESGRQLIEILDQFGVKATLVATHIGPAVTKFEVKPDLGVRVNKISNLQYDIKMALAAKDIRIEAPIPGKSAVGIEIPNVEKTMVHMKELLKTVPSKYEKSKLLFALGKDLMGNSVYGELNKMPHLLIAGATGSGKSVCVNSIITSILMRTKPDEVKLLLVDPKKVEFTPYRQVPHLLGPVITDGEEANRALKVIVNMMDKRYELFALAGVRNIGGYNTYIEEHPEEGLKRLPWIVVIIDELADLMLVAAKEVEASIQRITQLARAAGIHLIVATQRPSVDVITGVIKANIPSRIAFAVSSAVDSRTILDQMGAEKLLGYGDMLYIPVGETNAVRVQGVFVSDQEVQNICDFVSRQAKPKYEDAFLRLEALDSSLSNKDEEADPLYEEVKQFIISTRKASTSLIQRKFSIGYARAARLIDVLEERGIIGPSRGSKPREVLVRYEEEDSYE